MKKIRNLKDYWADKRVLVTGGEGFLGKHLVELLKKKSPKKIIIPSHEDFDLRELSNCKKICKNIDIVIHLAANVGGIGYNQKYPGTLFYDNLLLNAQMMEAARLGGISKYVAIGTVCCYPKITPVPFKEANLWNGYPEETNAPYGLAKKMQLVQSQAYRQQYGFNSIFLVPTNLYGPGDKFNPNQSHVIPALIKKIVDAKKAGDDHIDVWGTGKATREFLYAGDCARAILEATEKYNKSVPVNIGSGKEISIKRLVKQICEIVGFKGKVVWDNSKPDGQPRRHLDTTKAKKEFGFMAKVGFDEGLRRTIEWYINHERKTK